MSQSSASLPPRVPTFWQRHRVVLLGGAIVAWFVTITITHQRSELRARGTNKGAGELLQIGALPVT